MLTIALFEWSSVTGSLMQDGILLAYHIKTKSSSKGARLLPFFKTPYGCFDKKKSNLRANFRLSTQSFVFGHR